MIRNVIKALALAGAAIMHAAAVAAPALEAPNTRYLSPEFIQKYGYEYDPYGLATLLATQPGVALQSNGDPGGEDWLTMRGNPRDSSRMTLILLDGVPLNSASNATLEFNSIPLALIHDITIYYGPLPARYGGYTSLVEISTRSASNRAELTAYGGSKDTIGGGGAYSRAGDDWGITLDLRAHQTEGLEGQQTEHRSVDNSNPFDPQVETTFPVYESRDYDQVVPTITGHYNLEGIARVGLLAQGVFTDKDYADGKSTAEPDRPAQRERDYYTAGLSLRPLAGSGRDFELNIFYKDEDKETLALDDEFVNYGEQDKSHFGVRGYYGLSLNDQLHLRVGGEYNDFDGDVVDDTIWDPVNEEIIDEKDSIYFTLLDELDNHAFFAEGFFEVFEGTTLGAGVRYDDIDDTKSDTSYQLTFTARLGERAVLHASGGRTSRYPSLNEYNNSLRDPTVLGPPVPGLVDPADVDRQNGELEMETQTGAELGLSYTWLDSKLVADITVYSYDHDDEIFVDVRPVPTNPDSAFFPILGPETGVLFRNNRPTTDESEGAELSVEYTEETYGAYLSATYNDLKRTYNDGRESHNQPFMPPDYYVSAGGYVDTGFGELSLQVLWRDDTPSSLQERGPLPDVELDDSFIAHLGYKYAVTDSLEVFARAHNLFDEDYETFYGLPMMGRHITGGIKVRF